MIQRIYSIRDVHNGFGHPFIDSNDESAKRNFAYSVNSGNVMGFSPMDYDLYFLAEFDSEKGTFVFDLPELVIHATDVFGK